MLTGEGRVGRAEIGTRVLGVNGETEGVDLYECCMLKYGITPFTETTPRSEFTVEGLKSLKEREISL